MAGRGRFRFLFLYLGLIMLCVPAASAWAAVDDVLEVRYAARLIDSDLSDYEKHWQGVLKLALEKSGYEFRLVPVSGKGLTHARIARSVSEDGMVNLAYMGTCREFESQLRPIRIPVFRGLIGYRILMIRSQDQSRFTSITGLSDLTREVLGLGIHWSDVSIMEKAGFTVVQMPYESLFKALQAGRFDAVSRAAHEIEPELQLLRRQFPDLAAEQSIIIGLRQASFFFVSRDNPRLAAAIETGLLRAYEDGSFMAFFNNSPVVERARQILEEPGRRLFWVENQELTSETQAIPDRFWFALDK